MTLLVSATCSKWNTLHFWLLGQEVALLCCSSFPVSRVWMCLYILFYYFMASLSKSIEICSSWAWLLFPLHWTMWICIKKHEDVNVCYCPMCCMNVGIVVIFTFIEWISERSPFSILAIFQIISSNTCSYFFFPISYFLPTVSISLLCLWAPLESLMN